MIAEAVIVTGLFITGTPAVLSRAVSDTAAYIATESEKNRDSFMKSLVLGQSLHKSIHDLQAVATECSSSGWDGYNADPVSADTYGLASQFLKVLPSYSQPTSVGAEPDGHITLEWYHSQRRLLSLSISPEGMLYYAALFGTSKQYGSEPFLGSVPQPIINMIHRVAVA